jgi:hypothetical protein
MIISHHQSTGQNYDIMPSKRFGSFDFLLSFQMVGLAAFLCDVYAVKK